MVPILSIIFVRGAVPYLLQSGAHANCRKLFTDLDERYDILHLLEPLHFVVVGKTAWKNVTQSIEVVPSMSNSHDLTASTISLMKMAVAVS